MKAIIPVAGTGTRLRPFTVTQPKPLLPVAGKPILAHILDSLISVGIDEFILIIGYMGEKIREYVEEHYDVGAEFVTQEELLGLGYAIKLGLDRTDDEPVLIALGDTIIEVGLKKVISEGKNTIGVHKVEDPRRFGVVELENGRVVGLEEKPDNPRSNLAITSPYFFKSSAALREALVELVQKKIKTRGEYQLTDAMRIMLDRGEEMGVVEIEGWFDCGTVETLIYTNRHLLERAEPPDALESVVFIPPVYIGKNTTIERSVIGPNVSIGDNSVIRDAIVKDSIIGNYACAENCLLKGSILGDESAYHGRCNRMILGDHSEGGFYSD